MYVRTLYVTLTRGRASHHFLSTQTRSSVRTAAHEVAKLDTQSHHATQMKSSKNSALKCAEERLILHEILRLGVGRQEDLRLVQKVGQTVSRSDHYLFPF